MRSMFPSFEHIALRADAVTGELYIKNREAGDKISLCGMTKLTKKLYCDKKVPLGLRSVLPVFCDGGGIICIPGVAVRDGAAAKDGEDAIHIYYAHMTKANEANEANGANGANEANGDNGANAVSSSASRNN